MYVTQRNRVRKSFCVTARGTWRSSKGSTRICIENSWQWKRLWDKSHCRRMCWRMTRPVSLWRSARYTALTRTVPGSSLDFSSKIKFFWSSWFTAQTESQSAAHELALTKLQNQEATLKDSLAKMAALSEGLAKDKVELNRILLQVSSSPVTLYCNFNGRQK